MHSALRIGLLPSMGVGAASRNKTVVMMSEDGDTALGNPRVSIECICRNLPSQEEEDED